MTIKIIEVAYHRNGVSGEGFHAVLFKQGEGLLIAAVFEQLGHVAVFEIGELAMQNIAFAMGNSWRGDHYEADLRAAISLYEDKRAAA